MPTIKNKQIDSVIKDISWKEWDSGQEYKDTKHDWIITDIGDPIILFHRATMTHQYKRLGIYDRKQAQIMKSRRLYLYDIKEIEKGYLESAFPDSFERNSSNSFSTPIILAIKRLGLKYTKILSIVERHPIIRTLVIISVIATVILFLVWLIPLIYQLIALLSMY